MPVAATVVASLISAAAAMGGAWVGAHEASDLSAQAQLRAAAEQRAAIYAAFAIDAQQVEADIENLLFDQMVEIQMAEERHLAPSAMQAVFNRQLVSRRALARTARSLCAKHATLFVIGPPHIVAAADEVCSWGSYFASGKMSSEDTHSMLTCSLYDFYIAVRHDLKTGAEFGPDRRFNDGQRPAFVASEDCEGLQGLYG